MKPTAPRYDPALTDSIMRQVRIEAESETLHRQRRTRLISASLACTCIATALWFTHTLWQPTDPLSQSCAELATRQNLTGEWHLDTDPSQRYTPAATALAIHALAQKAPDYAPEILAGVNALLSHQSPQGAFGDTQATGQYNHAIVTQVLADLYRTGNYPLLKVPLQKALHTLSIRQLETGGWALSSTDQANRFLTAWNYQTLKIAQAATLPIPNRILGRAKRLLNRFPDIDRDQSKPPAIYYDAFIQLSGGRPSIHTLAPKRFPRAFLAGLK